MNEAPTVTTPPRQVKPTRNKIEEGTSAEPKAGEPGFKPVSTRPAVDMKINRKVLRQAKQSQFNFDPAGFRAVRLEYWVPAEHTYENLREPSYWTPVVEMLKRYGNFTGSIICARTDDHQYYAELYVTEVSAHGLYTYELMYHKLGVVAGELSSEKFKWIWSPSLKGYDILRIEDGATVVSAKEMKRLQSVKDWLEKWDI